MFNSAQVVTVLGLRGRSVLQGWMVATVPKAFSILRQNRALYLMILREELKFRMFQLNKW